MFKSFLFAAVALMFLVPVSYVQAAQSSSTVGRHHHMRSGQHHHFRHHHNHHFHNFR